MATVLAVDDDPSTLFLLKQLLPRFGHAVITAADGGEALQRLSEHAVDIVLTDMVMPGRSGLDLLRIIRSRSQAIPVVIMTGKPSIEAAVDCLKSGAADFLTKPLNPDKLREVIGACLAAQDGNMATVVMPAHPVWRAITGYTIRRILGIGGCGVVYLADKEIDGHRRTVALKVIRDEVRAAMLDRFAREARVVAELRHPNIVRIWDFDVAAETQIPYIAMEYVPGRTLGELEQHATPEWDWGQRVRLVRQVAAALAAIHSYGICHRDIKPHNIMVTDDFTAKLTDFGMVRTPASTLTGKEELLGTPAYMAPECYDGSGIDTRSDLFSLGALTYELLVGITPFHGDTLMAMGRAVMTGLPPAPRDLNPDVPKDLERIVARLLRKSPSERYQQATELIADLDTFLAGRPLAPVPATAGPRQADWAGTLAPDPGA